MTIKHTEQRVVRDEHGRVSRVEAHEWTEGENHYAPHTAAVDAERAALKRQAEQRQAAPAVAQSGPRATRVAPATIPPARARGVEIKTFAGEVEKISLLDLADLGFKTDSPVEGPGLVRLSDLGITPSDMKADDTGALVATFSRFNEVDKDGDITLSSAIADGTPVVLGSYNHSSGFLGNRLPIGKGIVRNDGARAQIVAQIFDTPDAQAEYAVIKGLGKLAEWSYTLRVLDYSTDANELRPYGPDAKRILKSLDVVEVCAVIRGAGNNTRTDSAKRGVLLSDLGMTPSFFSETARTLRDLDRNSGLVRLADLGLNDRPADDAGSRFIRI